MPELSFTIDLEKHGVFVVEIHLKQQGEVLPKGRVLYKDTLEAHATGQQKEAVLYLIDQELKRLGVPPHSSRAAAIPLNRVTIPVNCSNKAIQLVALSGKLKCNERTLVFNPFTPVSVYYELSIEEAGVLCIEGKWRLGDKEGSLSTCDGVFPGNPCWLIKEGFVHWIEEEIEWKWIKRVFPNKERLMGEHKEQFLALLDKKQSNGMPQVVWRGESNGLAGNIEPLPYLVLTDRTGAFANLGFDYGYRGKWLASEMPQGTWRDIDAEKGWEKDLLETDFVKKMIEISHYYCPLDKVAKSLTFLLEIGWSIVDFRGKQVVRESHSSLSVHAQENKIIVRGTICYAEHEADIQHLVGAFNRRERFLDLSEHTVGLIDPVEVEKNLGELVEEELSADGIVVRGGHFSSLTSLMQHPNTTSDPQVRKMVEREWVECTPSSLFKGELLPYQQEGLNWLGFLCNHGFHGILADEMGLGKTVQILGLFSQLLLKAKEPLLIIVPTSLLFNWRKEFEKFLPQVAVWTHAGQHRAVSEEYLKQQRVILTSYTLLRLDADLFQRMHFNCVVLDEAQVIKNPDSQIAKVAYTLKATHRVAVTGTPLENSPDDLWSLFHFLMPGFLDEKREFHSMLLAGQSDRRYLTKMQKRVSPFILRRRKTQVLQELPEKLSQVIWVDMEESQRTLYEQWVKKNRLGLLKKVEADGASSHRMEIFEAILRLRQICCHPALVDGEVASKSGKMERLLADLEEIVAEGRKALVYSQFTQMLQLIEQEVTLKGWKYVYLDGSTKDREEVVEQFQSDQETSLFLISLKAGGVGLNLTAADYVLLFDPWWNDAVEEQAIGRAHRLGRAQTVIARRYISASTIEEKMMRIKDKKTALAQGLLEFEESLTAFTIEDLTDLLAD